MDFVRYKVGPVEVDGPTVPDGQVTLTLLGRIETDADGQRRFVTEDWIGPRHFDGPGGL